VKNLRSKHEFTRTVHR